MTRVQRRSNFGLRFDEQTYALIRQVARERGMYLEDLLLELIPRERTSHSNLTRRRKEHPTPEHRGLEEGGMDNVLIDKRNTGTRSAANSYHAGPVIHSIVRNGRASKASPLGLAPRVRRPVRRTPPPRSRRRKRLTLSESKDERSDGKGSMGSVPLREVT